MVETRRNRQANRPRPYSQFRKPFIQKGNENEKPQQQELKQKLKSAEELNTEELITHMRCEYADIEEDMHNKQHTKERYNISSIHQNYTQVG